MKFRMDNKSKVNGKLTIIFTFLLLFSSYQMASSGSWPMLFHDPQNTGNTTSTAPNTNITLWTRSIIGGNGWSSPVVANGRVFIRESNGGTLHCLYEINGTDIWNTSIGIAGMACSTPTVANGKVFVIGDKLYCLYENNGTFVWNKTISGGGTGVSSPKVDDGKVFVNTQTLYCFYANNGTEIWSKSISGFGYSTPAIANGKVFVIGDKLYCFYANNGTEVWSKTGGGSNSQVIVNGKVFYNPDQIKCLYENNGSEIWSKPNGGNGYSSPALSNSKVYVNNDGIIRCFYEYNGTERWNKSLGITGFACSTPALTSDGKLIVNGEGFTFCLNNSNGAEIWKIATGGEGYSSPAVANGRVFVNQGTVYCFGNPPPTIDHILIRDAPGGEGKNLCDPANYPSYPVGYSTTFYGAAYNKSAPGDGYIFDVPVTSTWESNDTALVTVAPLVGNSTTIICSSTNSGWVWIVLDDGKGHTNQTKVTIIGQKPVYILIRDAPNGGGRNLCDPANYQIYPVGYTATYYAAAYNNSNFIIDIPVFWSSDDDTIVNVTTFGSFTSVICSITNYGTVNITFNDGEVYMNSTQITVLEPRVDYIQIRDEPGGEGNVTTTVDFMIGGVMAGMYYCAAYNHTAGYIGDRSAEWSVNGGIGTLNPVSGISTNFTVTDVGTGNITVNLTGIINSTGTITVNPDTTPPAQPNEPTVNIIGKNIEISWSANSESDLAGYRLYRREQGGDWELIVTVNASTTTYIDEGVEAGKTYEYRLRAIDDNNNESLDSNVASIKVPKPQEEEASPILNWILLILAILVGLLLIFILFKKRKSRLTPSSESPTKEGESS
ncbi:MAG: PQQ-binding-like beta-propeller repeat protein [Thermoplasmata archaeon]|nr:MAG: PQQ-binding-like beta-propeller repeat protein [Thermoplasmata archaeon]